MGEHRQLTELARSSFGTCVGECCHAQGLRIEGEVPEPCCRVVKVTVGELLELSVAEDNRGNARQHGVQRFLGGSHQEHGELVSSRDDLAKAGFNQEADCLGSRNVGEHRSADLVTLK